MNKKGFRSIQKKLRYFSIILTAGLAVVFVLTQFLMGRVQSNSTRVYSNYSKFSGYWNKMQETDRTLYSYAQTPMEENREACRLLLKELREYASALSQVVGAEELQDLSILTDKYSEAGERILDHTAETEVRISWYNTLSEYKWILEGLYDTLYQKMQEYLETGREQLARMWRNLNLITIVLEAMLLALIVIWLHRLAKKITQPVRELTRQTEEIIGGNRRIEMRYHTDIRDELDILNNSFYEMVETNNRNYDSLKKQKELEERLTRTQLRLLQSRVNPHFMFNTLNLIAGLAATEDAEKTTDMLIQTAKYLRYALVCLDKAVYLEDEVDHATDYMKIQKARFDDRFQMEVEIEEEARRAVVPSMILQPLCENALGYGMSSLERPIVVRMRASVEKDRLTVSVEDNGGGMSRERLEEIRRRIAHAEEYDDAQGIGIVNTFQRLQFFCQAVKKETGEDSVACRVESEPFVCTRITFIMPFLDRKPSEIEALISDERERRKHEDCDC